MPMQMPLETLKKFWGGAAISTKILWDYTKTLEQKGVNLKEFDPFSPENMLIFGTGPGTGVTGFPSPGRHHVMTLKSPLTGSIGSANSGGQFGAYLKRAGVDGIVIVGKATSPVYLEVIDGKIEIKPADDLWGKTVFETDDLLQAKYEAVRKADSITPPEPPNKAAPPISRASKWRAGSSRASGRWRAQVIGGDDG